MEEKKSSSSKDVIPLRNGFGNLGKPIKVSANVFEIKMKSVDIIMYAIIYPEKPVLDKRDLPQIVDSLLRDYADDFKGAPLVHDEARLIFCAGSLKFREKEFTVRFKKDELTLTVRSVSSVNLGSLLDYSKDGAGDLPRDAMQALEVVLGYYPRMNMTSAGRGYFDGKTVFEISDGAEVWLGYRQAVKIGQGRVYLNVDMANSAFRAPEPVFNILSDIAGGDIVNVIRRNKGTLPRDVISKADKKLKGIKVEGTYMGGKRSWKINGFGIKTSRTHKFAPGDDEKEVTVQDYFRTKFKINLEFPDLPLLHVGPKNRNIMLPIELCAVAKGQRLNKLNPRQTADMIKIAAKPPAERLKWITNAEKALRDPDTKSSVANAFGVSIGNSLAQVDGRVLPPPKILYNPDQKESEIIPRGGQWRADNSKFFKPCTFKSWGVISFERDRFLSERDVQGIVQSFIDQGRKIGMTFPQKLPPFRFGDSRNDRAVHESIDDVLGLVQRTYKEEAQLLLVILPGNAGSQLYGEVKRYCDTEVDVVTQCVVSNKVKKRQPMYIGNVLLKINVKAGGINWTIPRERFFMNVPAIIFGADVTHAGPGSPLPSIASVVASMDGTASRYACVLKSQGRRVEIIEDLANIAKSLLIKFYRATKRKPEKILFYRDGVSEGQFQEVLSSEVSALRQACESLEENYRPTITFIVVRKRHNVRLFPNPRDADRSGNVPAGLVVDRGITHPSQFDFFLNSHAGLQGTSRPCHYHVLADENGFTANTLQDFTNKLCYTYVRCTKAVSLVPPVYYAHLGAARARYHAKGDLYHDNESVSSGKSGEKEVEFNTVKPRTDSVMYFV